jgi:type IV secretory pathway VirB10-like protein
MATEDIKEVDKPDLSEEQIDLPDDDKHPGGGRFSRLGLIVFAVVAIVSGVVVGLGVQSSGPRQEATAIKPIDDSVSSARANGEIADLAAHGSLPLPAPSFVPAPPVIPAILQPAQRAIPQATSRYAQWESDKYLKALEAPQMVSAFHGGQALEIADGDGHLAPDFDTNRSAQSAIALHAPASPYTVMAGSVIPALLISGIDSDLPGPILAQVSQGLYDTATGRSLLVPQGSRLIGAYQSPSAYGQQRVQIAWQRIIFPNTSSMDLPQMPGADQAGYVGFSDQTNNHYARTFGTAAFMSLLSAGQMVGQMSAFGGGGAYGPYGYYQPNQWAMAGETAGSAASGQFGALGQQMIGQGANRPPTLQIRPGYQFNVIVTQDLSFPGAYRF